MSRFPFPPPIHCCPAPPFQFPYQGFPAYQVPQPSRSVPRPRAPSVYAFSDHTESIPWDEVESLHVDQIARTGDLDSVLFYMDKLVTADLTEEDGSERFGTRASVNAFTILQLGADYLRDRHQELSDELDGPEQSAAEQFRRREADFRGMMENASSAVMERDEHIRKLRALLGEEERRARQLKALVDRARRKVKERERYSRRRGRRESGSEPGAFPEDVPTRRTLRTGPPVAARRAEEEELSEGQVPLTDFQVGRAEEEEEERHAPPPITEEEEEEEEGHPPPPISEEEEEEDNDDGVV